MQFVSTIDTNSSKTFDSEIIQTCFLMMKQMLLDTLRTQDLKTFWLNTIVLAILLMMRFTRQ
jgi:hypothetical protein